MQSNHIRRSTRNTIERHSTLRQGTRHILVSVSSINMRAKLKMIPGIRKEIFCRQTPIQRARYGRMATFCHGFFVLPAHTYKRRDGLLDHYVLCFPTRATATIPCSHAFGMCTSFENAHPFVVLIREDCQCSRLELYRGL
jgi:hypothetical protein